VQHLFYDLDATPLFISAVAAPPAPYNGPEESAFYPTAEDITRALEQLARE
jgi:2-oxoisovalerate dehydrogenase E1 component